MKRYFFLWFLLMACGSSNGQDPEPSSTPQVLFSSMVSESECLDSLLPKVLANLDQVYGAQEGSALVGFISADETSSDMSFLIQASHKLLNKQGGTYLGDTAQRVLETILKHPYQTALMKRYIRWLNIHTQTHKLPIALCIVNEDCTLGPRAPQANTDFADNNIPIVFTKALKSEEEIPSWVVNIIAGLSHPSGIEFITDWIDASVYVNQQSNGKYNNPLFDEFLLNKHFPPTPEHYSSLNVQFAYFVQMMRSHLITLQLIKTFTKISDSQVVGLELGIQSSLDRAFKSRGMMRLVNEGLGIESPAQYLKKGEAILGQMEATIHAYNSRN